MMRLSNVLAALAFWLLVLAESPTLFAQGPQTMAVGTKEAPPFSFKNADGKWEGISIQLWEMIAAKLNWETTWRECELKELITGLEKKDLDISVAGLTVTAAREKRVDFSQPFLSSGLAIAIPREGNTRSIWGQLFSMGFLKAIGALAAVLIFAALLVWIFERKKNEEEFGGDGARGLFESFWWSAVTMTTVGYGDKSPKTLGGRIVALVWMFASVIIISSFTAAIASSLTVSRLESALQGPDDLVGLAQVATVDGSTSEAWLLRRGIRYRGFKDLRMAMQSVADGSSEAVVYDAPMIKHLVSEDYAKDLLVVPGDFERYHYAFAMPLNSPQRKKVNAAMLEVLEDVEWKKVVHRYLGRQ